MASTDNGSAPFTPPPRPSRLRVLLYKAPLLLYRFNLGFLLGTKFLMLTHRGRKSGRIRHTVLEVIRFDPKTKESLVISAYGRKADWYRNIRANPALKVRTGRMEYSPRHRFLNEEEAYAAFLEFERCRAPFIRRLVRLLGARYDGSEEGRRRLVSFLRMVAFQPKSID